MKRYLAAALVLALAAALVGCGALPGDEFSPESEITLMSREDGSGTRGAFVELLGIEQVNEDGKLEDMTAPWSDITNSTAVMLTSVADNPSAIGYVSLGSMSAAVKTLTVNGAAISAETIKNGEYKIARPFNIATLGEPEGVCADFIDFIMSSDGQAVVERKGYVAAAADAGPYGGLKPAGRLVISGSTSVAPVMEKLAEEYKSFNPNAAIELQQSDSTTGLAGAVEGVCDIGMSSRELKDSELAKGLVSRTIALDGIAVIVNPLNPVSDVTDEQVMKIYTGEYRRWREVMEALDVG